MTAPPPETPRMTESKPNRRLFRYSLRTLLVATTVFCVWLGFKVNVARRQREATEAIKKAGGTVWYDYQFSKKSKPLGLPFADYTVDTDAQSPAPGWLRFLMGDDCFRTVVAVYFNQPNPNLSKADVDQIAKLPALKHFVLEAKTIRSKIQDADLAALKQVGQLEILQLFDAHVTGAMLQEMNSVKSLTALAIVNSDLDDAAMEQIGKMSNLQCLWLAGSRITDEGLRHLRNLTNLKQLYLNNTAVTSAGLLHLVHLKQLLELWLPTISINELQRSLPNTTTKTFRN